MGVFDASLSVLYLKVAGPSITKMTEFEAGLELGSLKSFPILLFSYFGLVE